MDDALAALVTRLEGATGQPHDPATLRAFAASVSTFELATLIEEGYLSVEALIDAKVESGAVQGLIAVLAQAHIERGARAAQDAQDPAVGMTVCLAGVDDVEAALDRLGLDDEAREAATVVDGYLYVPGVSSAEIEAALVGARSEHAPQG